MAPSHKNMNARRAEKKRTKKPAIEWQPIAGGDLMNATFPKFAVKFNGQMVNVYWQEIKAAYAPERERQKDGETHEQAWERAWNYDFDDIFVQHAASIATSEHAAMSADIHLVQRTRDLPTQGRNFRSHHFPAKPDPRAVKAARDALRTSRRAAADPSSAANGNNPTRQTLTIDQYRYVGPQTPRRPAQPALSSPPDSTPLPSGDSSPFSEFDRPEYGSFGDSLRSNHSSRRMACVQIPMTQRRERLDSPRPMRMPGTNRVPATWEPEDDFLLGTHERDSRDAYQPMRDSHEQRMRGGHQQASREAHHQPLMGAFHQPSRDIHPQLSRAAYHQWARDTPPQSSRDSHHQPSRDVHLQASRDARRPLARDAYHQSSRDNHLQSSRDDHHELLSDVHPQASWTFHPQKSRNPHPQTSSYLHSQQPTNIHPVTPRDIDPQASRGIHTHASRDVHPRPSRNSHPETPREAHRQRNDFQPLRHIHPEYLAWASLPPASILSQAPLSTLSALSTSSANVAHLLRLPTLASARSLRAARTVSRCDPV
ncbi:hypothetical protein EJ06DRAFT_519778 [Trichodelitschia bisporula]|uniref:Uncharacterized protein n=1 Tax=Trichodelitschia bisporula TaxID=703511 RepID=A0A6G1I371_9PEZI|nr:hypothetical protein EJ06DRAFT_519778 [Trichodelitschia bisporula]